MDQKGDQSGVGSVFQDTDTVNDHSAEPPAGSTRPAGAADDGRPVAPQIDPKLEKLFRDMGQVATAIHEFRRTPKPGEALYQSRQAKPAEPVKEPSPTEASYAAASNKLQARVNAADCLPEDCERKLVDFVRAAFLMSHRAIEPRYDYWRDAEKAHDLYVPTRELDRAKKSKRNGKPRIVETIMTPYSRAISDTRTTYNLAIFGGMPPFRFEPANAHASRRSAKIVEQALAQNMRRIGYEGWLVQMSMDMDRYGMAPLFVGWNNSIGNEIMNIDPWCYFPDPRVTAQNRGEGDFFGVRSWASKSALQRRGVYSPVKLAKLDSKAPARSGWECNRMIRDTIRDQQIDATDPGRGNNASSNPEHDFTLGSAHVLNTLWVWLDPTQFGLQAPFDLYRITVADEQHIIRFDVTPYGHGGFPVIHGEPGYDAHKTFPSGLYDLLAPLQRYQDWLLRARVENVQSMVANRLIVDPHRIMLQDIINPNSARVIRSMPGADIGNAVLPLSVPDATRGYWQDLDATGQLMQRLGAASDTAQGIQTETERTATEIARLTSLGQQRLGMNARLISARTMRPLVELMLDNMQRFGLEGGMVQLPKEYADDQEDGWYRWTQDEILGRFDYVVADGTLPLDPRENAENLIRAIRALSETGAGARWDMDRFVERLIQVIGFEDVDNWKLDEAGQQSQADAIQRAQMARNPQIAAQMAQMSNQVRPDADVMAAADRGDAVPISQAVRELGQPGVTPPPGPMVPGQR